MTPLQYKESEELRAEKAQKASEAWHPKLSSSRRKLSKFYKDHLLGWIGAALILFGYYLNANEMIQSWPVWIVGNLLIGKYCLDKKAYPAAAMSFLLVIFNFYGYFSWK
jgi:hypothetical protein